MLGKAIWWLRIQENPSVAGVVPRTPLGSLQRSHKPISWWGGAGFPSPRTLSRRSRPFGPHLSYPTPKLVPMPLTMQPIDDRWIPIFLENSHNDWCFCDALFWPNIRSPTRSYTQQCTQCMSATPWTTSTVLVSTFLTASKKLCSFQLLLRTFSATSV